MYGRQWDRGKSCWWWKSFKTKNYSPRWPDTSKKWAGMPVQWQTLKLMILLCCYALISCNIWLIIIIAFDTLCWKNTQSITRGYFPSPIHLIFLRVLSAWINLRNEIQCASKENLIGYIFPVLANQCFTSHGFLLQNVIWRLSKKNWSWILGDKERLGHTTKNQKLENKSISNRSKKK